MSATRGTSGLALTGGILLVTVGTGILSQSLDDLAFAVLGLLLVLLGVEGLVLAGVRTRLGRGSRARLRTHADGSTVTSVREAHPDQVDLSPAGITSEHFGRRTVVRWEDVHGCVPPEAREPMALVLLARVVALCAADPSLRISLGAEASLDWLTFPRARPG